MLMNSNEYLNIVESIKQEIRTAQYRATVSVNRELLVLYHSIGEVINEHKTWGNKFVENLAADIKISGFIENLVVFYLENSGHKITLYTKRWFALANHFFLCYNIFRYFSIFGGFLLTLNQYLL